MEKQEYIQCPYCGSPNVNCLDGSDMIGEDITVDICPDIYLCSDCKETFRLDEIDQMRLEVTEVAWGIDRMTGEKSETVSGWKIIRCNIGELPIVGVANRRFYIDKITKKSIVLSVHAAIPKYNKTWRIYRGKSITYKPLSYDGGHYYIIKLR